jgi:hypothetical protein
MTQFGVKSSQIQPVHAQDFIFAAGRMFNEHTPRLREVITILTEPP